MLHRSNPFATRFVRPGALDYRFADCEDPQSRLSDMTTGLDLHRVGLIVGPHGSGKSTLVKSWLPKLNSHFAATEHVQLCGQAKLCWIALGRVDRWRRQRRIARQLQLKMNQLPVGGLLIVDGAEQLGLWRFGQLCHRIRKRNQTLLATCHRPIAGAHVLHRTSVTPQLVVELTQHLLRQESHRIQRKVHQRLRHQALPSDGNVREFFFELYDLVHEYAEYPPTAANHRLAESDHTAIPLS